MRSLVLSAIFVLLAVPAAEGVTLTSCVRCHGALGESSAEPVRQWERDIHKDAGIGCHDCHGGDPDRLETAMAPSSGFVGAPVGESALRLCGTCHSATSLMPDPTMPTDQLEQILAGRHRPGTKGDGPTCVTCHGSHGIHRVTDPASPVFKTRIYNLCIKCHGQDSSDEPSAPWRYREDVHGQAVLHATNPHAPTCVDCHGAHRAEAPLTTGVTFVCGNCHTTEYDYFLAGPHGTAMRANGVPSCTNCHGYHGIRATGINEIIGRITDNCRECHQTASAAWILGREIDEKLGVAMSFLGSLEDMSEEFRLAGVESGEMDRLNQEAYGWLVQVESAIHSVDSDWEELTGMAKVKMMAAWDLARDYNLEKGIRRVILLFIGFVAAMILALLAYKLKLLEMDQRRRQLLGSPEARQREQEHHHK